jgi:hypothetical protein
LPDMGNDSSWKRDAEATVRPVAGIRALGY